MINKFSRSSTPVIRVSEQEAGDDTTSVYNEFMRNVSKYSVQSERSMYEELSAILNGTKPKFSSVEEVVQDMKERSGLKAFIDSKKAIAFIQEPAIFQKIPQMKTFIDNFIEARPGTSIESVIHDLLKMGDISSQLENHSDVDDEVKQYINFRLAEAKKKQTDHNSVDINLGKVDHSAPETGNDPLAICEPNVVK